MAQAKYLFFLGILTTTLGLQGCALPALYVAGSLGATEVVGDYALGDFKATGAELRQGADLSNPYQKHISVKLPFDNADWTCFRGKGEYLGGELCLFPSEAKKIANKSWFSCRYGRGGSITQLATRDYAYYCKLQTA